MDRDVMQRFRSLPRRPQRVWQGKCLRMLAWVTDEQGNSFRPMVPLWLDARQHAMSALEAVRPDEAGPASLLSRLMKFAVEDRRFRPGCIEVSDPAVAEYLVSALAGCEIDVRLTSQMKEMDKVEADLASFHRRGMARVDSLLDTSGVTLEQVRGFAEAAAALYQAAPWLQLCEDDLIRVHAPAPPLDMQFVTVLGAERSLYGLGLLTAAEDHYRLRNQKSGWQDLPLWQLSFGQITWIPIEDANLWDDHQLAVAGERAYPRLVKYEGPEVLRPTPEQLVFLEGLMRALASVTPKQLDRGRWTKTVLQSDGTKTQYSLSIPDLVRPPSPQQWMMRGYRPDRRIRDQLQLMLSLYASEQLGSVIEEGEFLMQGAAMGVSCAAIKVKPQTPQQQARYLCYQAIETFGRLRKNLALEALQHDPQCIEAHVILGELAPTLDEQLQHYQAAVAGGADWSPGELPALTESNPWSITCDPCHLRARLGLAITYDELGRMEETIELLQHLLQVDPQDSQHAHYLLLPRLMATKRDVEAARLLKAFRESSTHWVYAQAILAYRLSGDSDAARREIRSAFERNPHFPKVLTAVSPPAVTDQCESGSPEDATLTIEELLPAITATPGVVDWIVSQHRSFRREQQRGKSASSATNSQRKRRSR